MITFIQFLIYNEHDWQFSLLTHQTNGQTKPELTESICLDLGYIIFTTNVVAIIVNV